MGYLPACIFEGCTRDTLVYFGLALIAYIAYSSIVQFVAFLRAYVLSSTPRMSQYGSWAVITGATDGIGKAYAEELARGGMNIFIISRTQSKLDQFAQELAEKYPNLEVRTLAMDFSGNTGAYDALRAALLETEVGVLVNNVGVSYEYPMKFHELGYEQVENMINLNTLSMSLMTHIVLPGMLERRRGAIINISSASGLAPSPMLAQYSATKAYADFFTRAIATEYSDSGIVFQSVMPFFVATKLAKIRKASITVPSPTAYVRSALRTLGVRDVTQGYWSHALQACIFFRLLPGCVVSHFAKGMGMKLRASALRRKARNDKDKKKE